MATVVLDRVTKRYGKRVLALDDISITFGHGDFVCVLGPSGSGKSTILKLIAGIEECTSGRILFDGLDVTPVTPERRDLAMVFQSYALYPTMTVFDNLAFPLRVRRVRGEQLRQRVQRTAGLLGISGLLDRYPRQLSGGERQRVALGRAIIREPRAFLLDEPMSNLDANLRAQMRLELKRLHGLLQATFIYVTHDQDDALGMGDRVAILSEGRLQQYAAPTDVYEEPANRFVASFIGRLPMNLFRGELGRIADSVVFRNSDVTLRVPEEMTVRCEAQRPVVLGVRPEAVLVAAPDDSDSQMRGTVSIVEVVQPNVYASVQVGPHSVLARIPEGTGWAAPGQTVGLAVAADKLHLFDADTGERLNQRAGAAS